MDENDKRVFDALEAWRGRLWQEYTEKTSLEWKFSYSLWGALLGASGLVIGNRFTSQKSLEVSPLVTGTVVALAVLLHTLMMIWIHGRLRYYRRQITAISDRIRLLVKAGAPPKRSGALGLVSPILQVCLTALLSGLLAWNLRVPSS